MLVPHVPVVCDSNRVLVNLSLIVDDPGCELSSGPLEDHPAMWVSLPSLNGLLLELVDDSSLLLMMVRTTSGAGDNSGCCASPRSPVHLANICGHLLLGTIRDLAHCFWVGLSGSEFSLLSGNLILGLASGGNWGSFSGSGSLNLLLSKSCFRIKIPNLCVKLSYLLLNSLLLPSSDKQAFLRAKLSNFTLLLGDGHISCKYFLLLILDSLSLGFLDVVSGISLCLKS